MGVIFYETLTGHIPYGGDSAVTIAAAFPKPLPSIIAENRMFSGLGKCGH